MSSIGNVSVNMKLFACKLSSSHHLSFFVLPVFQNLFRYMDDSSDEILNYAQVISAPTQIMWGKNDELLHVSNAVLLWRRLQNCQRVDIFDKCGHVPNIDCPATMAEAISNFRGEGHRKPKFIFL